jgi:uncharacterized membrane protein
VNRRQYLDWLRGIGVLIMVEAHTLDSWTRVEDRGHAYGWAMVVGGFGAPTFLFLAGVSLALAVGSRLRKGLSEGDAGARARRRGWQIFGLAFLFRLQSALISGGWSLQLLFKVDILNVMGLSMLAAAVLWRLGRGLGSRTILLASAATAVAMLTPIIRETPVLTPLPDPIEWYFRPDSGRTTFALFPWAGFLLAGSAVGLWLDRASDQFSERRAVIACAALGLTMALSGYAAAFLPPIYAVTNFWTSSPTFFFLRLGLLLVAVPVAYFWMMWMPGRSRIVEFGVASLFVYWIHVEMVYGVLSLPIHRRLTLGQAFVAFIVFSLFLFWLVTLKGKFVAWRAGSSSGLHENPAKGV